MMVVELITIASQVDSDDERMKKVSKKNRL